MRLLALLVLCGLAWWGYGEYFGDEARAEPRVDGLDAALSDLEPQPLQTTTADSDGSVGSNAASDDKVGVFIQALRDGDARSRNNVFVVCAKARDESDLRRISAALIELCDELDVAEAVGLLGSTNAFLHSDIGRRAAARVTARIHELPSETAIGLSTTVLEAAMNGPITSQDSPAQAVLDTVYERHKNLVRRVVFDPANAARSRRYEVASGDSLDRIAQRFRKAGVNVASGTLAIVNRIDNPNVLRLGQKLRIPIDPIRCEARRESFLLAVYVGDHIVRLYRMAHGKEGHETPETTFEVGEKIANPDWHHGGEVIPFGDPRNPLGRYFVKFSHESYTGFGAHGTNEPESIGTMASLGCLRLRPNDIEEFARLVPKGSEVRVR